MIETAKQVLAGRLPEGEALPAGRRGGGRPPRVALAGQNVPAQEIPEGMMALDIGPASGLLFKETLHDAKTIVWNGPMGVFEQPQFAGGTQAVMRALAESSATTIVGGGDTDTALHKAGLFSRMSYVSTGGGAFLELLEGKRLPGIAALEEA
jgi:phosphoglycerate kinase